MSGWTEPSNTFDSDTITGPSSGPAYGTPVAGVCVRHENVMNAHAVQLIASVVNAGGGQFTLQGSLDGENFYNLAATVGISNGTQLVVSENVPAQFVRGFVVPYTGDTPAAVLTVTALVVAQESE